MIHTPIAYQRGATSPAGVEPSGEEGGPIAGLLAEMNAYLDQLGMSMPRPVTDLTGRPPDVRFGCLRPGSGICDSSDAVFGGDEGPGHWLSVLRPSESWVSWLNGLLEEAGATRALLIVLEVSEYWPRSSEPHGDPAVNLGADHMVELRWHTSLEEPVYVIQVAGALVGSDGRALRIGAEGLLAKASSLLVSVLGAQAIITDEDVEQLRTMRREDLPGTPLVWEIALGTLVSNLLALPSEWE